MSQKGVIEGFSDTLDMNQWSILFNDSWQPCSDKRYENELIRIKTVNGVLIVQKSVFVGFSDPLDMNHWSVSFYFSWQPCSGKS